MDMEQDEKTIDVLGVTLNEDEAAELLAYLSESAWRLVARILENERQDADRRARPDLTRSDSDVLTQCGLALQFGSQARTYENVLELPTIVRDIVTDGREATGT